MLQRRRNGERAEDGDEDEDVVDRERLLHQIRGEELGRRIAARSPPDERVERERDEDPHAAPSERLTEAHLVRPPMQQPEVDRKKRGYQPEERDP